MVQGSPAYKEDKYSRTPINRRLPLTVQTRIVHGLRFRVAAPNSWRMMDTSSWQDSRESGVCTHTELTVRFRDGFTCVGSLQMTMKPSKRLYRGCKRRRRSAEL